MERPRRWPRLVPPIAAATWILLATGLGVASRGLDASGAEPVAGPDATAADGPGTGASVAPAGAGDGDAVDLAASGEAGAGAAALVAPAGSPVDLDEGPGDDPDDVPGDATFATFGDPDVTGGPDGTRRDRPDRVLLVGDSLTVGSADGVEYRLASGGYDVVIDAEVSRRTLAGVRALEDLEPTADDLVVVALGTNDLIDPAAFGEAVSRMLGAAGEAPVIWIDIDRRGYGPMNQVLVDRQFRGDLTVVTWSSEIAERPELRSGDRVHLDHAGYELRAEVVALAVVCHVEGCDALPGSVGEP